MISAGYAATLLSSGTDANRKASNLGSLSADGQGKMDAKQADKVSKDFESMFVGMMLEQMFGDSLGTEAFGDRETAEIYKSLMMDEYGQQIARAGGIGMADYVKRELLKVQEIAP